MSVLFFAVPGNVCSTAARGTASAARFTSASVVHDDNKVEGEIRGRDTLSTLAPAAAVPRAGGQEYAKLVEVIRRSVLGAFRSTYTCHFS